MILLVRFIVMLLISEHNEYAWSIIMLVSAKFDLLSNTLNVKIYSE